MEQDAQQRYAGESFMVMLRRPVRSLQGVDISAPILLENIHLMLIRQGKVSVLVNLEEHQLVAGSFIVLGPGAIYQIDSFTPDTVADILIIRHELLSRLPDDWQPQFLNDTSAFVVEQTDKSQRDLFALLTQALTESDRDGSLRMTDSMLSALIQYAAQFYQQSIEQESGNRQQEIFSRFLRLVSHHCRAHRHIGFYADQMALTQNHLSRIVSQHSGVTAKEWIERAVLLEAKVMLKHSDRSILDISEALNFPADSFFCKYFKRLTGMTPRQFRGL